MTTDAEKRSSDELDNLVDMLAQSVDRYGRRPWMGTKSKDGTYRWVTYAEVSRRIDRLRAGLASIGVRAGDTVGIIAGNRVEWAIACYASYGLGARFVPMYEAELLDTWRYIVRDSGAKVLFVSTDAIRERIASFLDEVETLEHIVVIDAAGAGSLASLEEAGAREPVAAVRPASSDIAALIYTSGTTGDPKGVLLSHGNLTSNIHAVANSFRGLDESTRTLSFLPWAHAYGQVAELHLLMHMGGSTGFAEGPTTIVDDLVIVRPTLLIAVPRIFHRVYDGLQATLAKKGLVPRTLFQAGLAIAKRRRQRAAKGLDTRLDDWLFGLARRVVFGKVHEKFGGELKMAVSSSAALSPHVAQFFFDIGLPVYEAWGMTELSPAATVSTEGQVRVGSAGKPLEKVRLVIDYSVVEPGARDGELIVYGPNVMQGYHNKPEATAAVMTEDGGLRSGDRAYIDDDGFLFITGRIKEQFKLENGKFIFPAAIEEEIKLLPAVEHVMVWGPNKAYTVCVVVPDFVALEGWAKVRGLATDREPLAAHPQLHRYLEQQIRERLAGKFGSYEIPRKIIVASEPFAAENGLLTPTLKLKRREVLERYGDRLEALYAS